MLMAIVKIVNRESGKPYALKAILDYIQNPKKTENGLYCSAKDCLLECAYQHMMNTKLDFHQDTGRQYIHIIQSFAVNDELNSATAHEIGRRLLESFTGFQGVVCTHTDRSHLHNHIVLNSVNWQTGRKWQSSKADLLHLREYSDKLCMEYGLSVIEKGKGWQRSGEYRANDKTISWKQCLAQDVAQCLKLSSNRQEFIHGLDGLGLDADFGKTNVMFFIRENGAKRYGLNKEMSCGNNRLMSYGDFSKNNIENMLRCNNILITLGWQDMMILQNALQEIGRMLFPDNPYRLENMYFDHIDFDGLTKQEIENYLKRKEMEKLSKKAQEEWEERNRKSSILPSIVGILAEILSWKKQVSNDVDWNHEIEDEYEI